MSSSQRNGFVLFLGSWEHHYQVLEKPSTFYFNQIVTYMCILACIIISLDSGSREIFFSAMTFDLFLEMYIHHLFSHHYITCYHVKNGKAEFPKVKTCLNHRKEIKKADDDR